MPADLPPAPALEDFKRVPPRASRVPRPTRPHLAVGDWLGMEPFPVTEAVQAQDLLDVREADPIYARERIVHPGTILRCCNWVLTHNVILPAWIHMGSTVRNLGIAHAGDTLNVRARITKNYEHKGHKWVELDAMVVANETTPVDPGHAYRDLPAPATGRGGIAAASEGRNRRFGEVLAP